MDQDVMMGRLGIPSVAMLLERQCDLLDRIFGNAGYSIESISPEAALVRSGALEWRVDLDARDRSIGSVIVECGVPGAAEASPGLWARFLGDEDSGWPKDQNGRVSLSLGEQMAVEIGRIAKLQARIFSDAQIARDAANFVRGYTTAYNDWARGELAEPVAMSTWAASAGTNCDRGGAS